MNLDSSKTEKRSNITTVIDDGNMFTYEMCRGGKGLLFNHENFEDTWNEADNSLEQVNNREGTRYDAQELINIFQNYNIDLEPCQDFPLQEIYNKIKNVSEMDHSKFDCLVVIVLTHGTLSSDGQEFIYAKDKVYSPAKLWLPFCDEMCPSLAGKPKIFIIQACRGANFNEGVRRSLIQTPSRTDSNVDWADMEVKVHNMPDLLIARSTFIGYKSFRNLDSGSIYIDSLTKVMSLSLTDLDIISLLTKVNREVSRQIIRYTDPTTKETLTGMQIPCFTSSLTKLLYFS